MTAAAKPARVDTNGSRPMSRAVDLDDTFVVCEIETRREEARSWERKQSEELRLREERSKH